MPRPFRTFALLSAFVLVAGCAPEDEEPPPNPAAALVGTWEITGEAGTLNRNGQRYIFGDDGTLQISRPRPLGPTTTIHAAYDFVDDSTLQVRTEFDAENVRPTIRGDSLLLRPMGTGDPMLLVRIPDAAPPPAPDPLARSADSVYSPPPVPPMQ